MPPPGSQVTNKGLTASFLMGLLGKATPRLDIALRVGVDAVQARSRRNTEGNQMLDARA